MGNRPQGIPFFARISSLEIACPDCDTVHICRVNQRRSFDRYTSTFRCRICGAIFVLGVLAYRTSRYYGGQTKAPRPADHTPTLRQSAQLRANLDAQALELALDQAQAEPTPLPAPEPPKPPKIPRQKSKLQEPKPTRQFFRLARAAKSLDSGGGLRLPVNQKYKHGQSVNLVVPGLCRCAVVDGDMSPVVAPDCPMHSIRAKESG